MTIQKLTADIGFLNDRANIICLSDEAHRTQLGTGEKVVVDAQKGVYETYGFAHYLREAFPKATFVGFTGTPIDETIHVFGEIVDRYSMKQAVRDGITVDIKYEARLARVKMDQEQAQKIEAFYKECEQEGADPAQIERSKNAMSSMEVILGDDGRLEKVANDIVQHYEQFTENRQGMVNKAMIVCANRQIAFKLYKKLVSVRPTWAEGDIPKLNFVATRGQNDPQELYELCGDRAHHKNLDIEFKKPESPFHIVIVVDMWITGFDVPNLTLLYNDKPLRRHSLIQTISRVNRKYEGKEFGLVVDYLGIRENMLKALKQYGGDGEGGSGTTIEQVEDVYETFKKILVELNELFEDFDMSPYFEKNSIVRYECLNRAVEFVLSQVTEQTEKEKKDRVPTFKTIFIQTVKRLKSAYDICQPAGKLNSQESALANFYMGVSNILSKYTSNGKDVAQMNKIVEEMVKKAIECTGVETILNAEGAEDLFGEGIWAEIHEIKAPNTKFQLLVKMMKRAIKEYSKVNKAKAQQFEQMLQEVIEEYNTRDKLIFTNSVAQDTVNAVQNVVEEKVQTYIDRIQDLFAKLKTDREEFKNMGITFEQKAFYDILVEVRNRYQFEYEDERCKELSIKISELIENSSIYANWLHNANIRSQLSFNLVALLYQEGYPPEWSNEIFEKVLDQVENFKKYN